MVQLKSGERKTGKILAESDSQILLDPETGGPVIEIRKAAVAIVERSPDSKGSVSFYTQAPRKIRPPVEVQEVEKLSARSSAPAGPAASPKETVQEISVEKLEAFFETWLAKHPEFKKWLEDLAAKAMKKSAQMDTLADAVKQT